MRNAAKTLVKSPGKTVTALFVTSLLVFGTVVVMIAHTSKALALQERVNAATRRGDQVGLLALQLLHEVSAAEARQRDYIMSGGDGRHLAPYYDARKRVGALTRQLSALAPKAEAQQVRALLARQVTTNDETIALVQEGRLVEARARLTMNSSWSDLDAVRDELIKLQFEARSRNMQLGAEQGRLMGQIRLLQLALAVSTMTAFLLALVSLIVERAAATRSVRVQAELNAELRAAHSAAEAAHAGKSRFLAMASHDMRQPLHAMSLYLASLQRRVQADDALEIIQNMERAVRTMSRLFSTLLDMARLEAGVLQPELSNFALRDLLNEIAAAAAGEPKDAARLKVVDTAMKAWTDPDLLEIVLRNLVENALKHAPSGRVLVGCRREGESVRIEVHNTGPGIPPEKLDRLFGEFVQGDDGPSAGGVGLGLAIVDRMTRLLGHQLSVRSDVVGGTVFAVTVPRVGGGAPQRSVADSPGELARARILLADDEPLVLEAMRLTLSDAGAEVVAVETADQIRSHLDEKFDLYVFDLNLGPDSGLELLEEVRERRGESNTLLVTAATTSGALASLKASGQAWITKPVTASTLRTAAVAAISGQRPIT